MLPYFQLITAFGLFSAIFVPSIHQEARLDFKCNDDISQFTYCTPPGGRGLDPCVVDRLIHLNSTEEIKCVSRCTIPPERWHEICNKWQIEEDCTVIKDDARFTAYVPKNTISNSGNCLHFGISGATFGDRNSSLSCAAKKDLFETSCRTVCDEPEVADIISEEITVKEASKLYQFWLLFLILIASWAGMAVVVSVGDAICFEMLGRIN